ncbi:MAG: FAD-dependent oxidoreductase [Gammaproteobacteria bacterium]|nr:FAD-dependent oxidoreductase [Gammaproteobacteria bacterium]
MSDQSSRPEPRLPAPYGLLIDRSRSISFTFEKQQFNAFEGDTIASALLASKQWLISRSFKYHRPRGPLTMAGQDANTLVQLPSAPNTLADKYPAEQGAVVSAQNYSGSLQRDFQAYTGFLSRFLPVGFYYKAFFRPRGIWEFWAKIIRRQAGLGVIDQSYDPRSSAACFDKQYKFADVAIIGGGPAGMSAALAAAESGAEVLLIEENPLLGGSLNYARFDPESGSATELRDRLVQKVLHTENIEVMINATCNSWHADNWLAVVAATRLYKLRTRELIVCSGSLQQQAVFRGNDIPGVVMSSAAQRLMHLYGVKPGKLAVILTGNNEGYLLALDLLQAGVGIPAIIDLRDTPDQTDAFKALSAKGVTIHRNSTVFEAIIDKRQKRVGAVEVRKILARGRCAEQGQRIECDLVCMSVGYMPAYQLACQAGGQLSYDDDSGMFSLTDLPRHFHIAGSVNGKWSLQAVTTDGEQIGRMAALHSLGKDVEKPLSPEDPQAGKINFPWPIFAHPKGKEFVDFDEDIQLEDIINATRDGYEHIQLVKRYSTCGMGPSQGRHSALATARIVADVTGCTVAETGVTTARPPFVAEQLAHNAGRRFHPARRSNMHYRHIEGGAQMMLAGDWYRPAYYGPADQSASLIAAEVSNVRNNVGLIDVSTLGGLEVRGRDAAEFMNRFYTFAFAKQPVGRARYALLTNDAGVVIDDGVACRFHDHHFYVTATTGGVGRVFQSMLKWNAQWSLEVDIANVTTAWCGVNVAGPNSREVLTRLCDDIDLSNAAFPYMGVRQGTVAGIPARLIRVGFVGELGFEVHVPQQYGEALWDSLIEAGKTAGIKPFGVEAQRLLRLEKGHVIIGHDTDAMSNPLEIQMGWAIARKKPFFVGARSLRELESLEQKRVLAGFIVQPSAAGKVTPIPLESQLVIDDGLMVGRVTSCSYSPTLEKTVGLAYVPNANSAPGNTINIKTCQDQLVEATVVTLPFYDTDNQRQEL